MKIFQFITYLEAVIKVNWKRNLNAKFFQIE